MPNRLILNVIIGASCALFAASHTNAQDTPAPSTPKASSQSSSSGSSSTGAAKSGQTPGAKAGQGTTAAKKPATAAAPLTTQKQKASYAVGANIGRGLAMRRTNLIPDIVRCELPLDNRRSPGYRRIEPFMTGNTFYLWIGQHENGRYSKAHAHTSAAVLICLQGRGYQVN